MKEADTLENLISGVTASDITDTTITSIIAAQGTNVRVYLTSIMVTNGSTTTDTRIDVLDGSTVKWTGYAMKNGGGFSHRFPSPLRGTANTAWRVQCGTSGAIIRVSYSGFTAFR